MTDENKALGLNALQPAPGSKKTRRRVGRGRGSKLGKTAGRGHKGQNSRSGGGVPAWFEGGQMPIHMRLPKFGFSSRIGRVTAEVRLGELNRIEGETVNLNSLIAAGVVRRDMLRARIVLSGAVERRFRIEEGDSLAVTRGARAAIEAAGGEVVEAPVFVRSKPKKPAAQADQTAEPSVPEGACEAPPETAAAASIEGTDDQAEAAVSAEAKESEAAEAEAAAVEAADQTETAESAESEEAAAEAKEPEAAETEAAVVEAADQTETAESAESEEAVAEATEPEATEVKTADAAPQAEATAGAEPENVAVEQASDESDGSAESGKEGR
ncbi:MAG: 50S ribosomal protein L15 [Gammaproteobacteria bacterium AqS3]|nr:50S ribosomal protein L15 [Gammaproteobacteria bacterium AqS3]